MGRDVHVTIVFDFMCPWSFIGIRSLELAVKKMMNERSGLTFFFKLLPLDFSDPGAPAEGMDWAEHCKTCGACGSKSSDLSSALQLGSQVGTTFREPRRVFHTETVNATLMEAQRFGHGLEFALAMLGYHFEHLQDPNDPELITQVWVRGLGLPQQALAACLKPTAARGKLTAELAQMARRLGNTAMPKFRVTCGDSKDMCTAAGQCKPISQEYFDRVFQACLHSSTKSTAPNKEPTPEIPRELHSMVDKLRGDLHGLVRSEPLKHLFVEEEATVTDDAGLDAMD
eukprot:TRINITY_DN45300_c0_g1_i1.p1 TRINITY_DN45300_c0_g1~~TRINITY_DN45300_c0_g1_i1.p1  ORF type:complete len:285 (-),score=54.20 TRINITY_DN45300_c0_g1_i1:23-877(-)